MKNNFQLTTVQTEGKVGQVLLKGNAKTFEVQNGPGRDLTDDATCGPVCTQITQEVSRQSLGT